MARTVARSLSLLVAGALLVGACGGDDDTTTTSDATAAVETSTTTEAAPQETVDSTTTASTPAAQPEGTLIEVDVRGGEVQGGGRTPVPLGETVTIRVTSDVDDHIHLHGYDVLADVAAGETAELVFTADIPGVFEVELEDAGIPLLELEIS